MQGRNLIRRIATIVLMISSIRQHSNKRQNHILSNKHDDAQNNQDQYENRTEKCCNVESSSFILTKQRGYAASNERGSAEVKYQWKECV